MRASSLVLMLLATSASAESVWLTNTGEQKISVIKEVRTATGLGLKDSKDLVESTPKPVKTGLDKKAAEDLAAKLRSVGATAEVRPDGAEAPAAKSAPAKASAEGTYTVMLQSFGQAKIPCIKVVKDTLGLGLKDAKELVEKAPVAIKTNQTKEDAEKLAKALNDAGGEAKALLAGN
ncbi:MAG: ribosomal protein L7/L12 [Archangiaceae bacterium]|nr:ribosomal protein L7/L12 [Archangiaceae bacterium]